jgi:hypothetical protein
MISARTKRTAKQLVASWSRTAISAALAYYVATGDMDGKAILSAALTAVIPPILRYLNPNDQLGA